MNHERGVTLVEVLVAMAFVLIGIGGTVLMALQSLQATQEAWFRASAEVIAYDMSETLIASGNAAAYLPTWDALIADALPSGTGLVAPVDATRFTVSVSWASRFIGDDGLPEMRTVVTTVRTP